MPTSPLPGNEPDTSDMSVEPGLAGEPMPTPADPGLLREEEEAAKLGDFA